MTGPDVLDFAREAIWVLLRVAGPVMLIGLTVGLTIAIFQSLTQVQEMTLVFVPKILAVFLSILLLAPFMGEVLSSFMQNVMELIISGPA